MFESPVPFCNFHFHALLISGLYNDNLFFQKDFDDGMSAMLSAFIQRQAAPACLVAHNGYRFDFPLLKSELQRLGKSLPHGLLCADSLDAFKAIDEEVRQSKKLSEEQFRITVTPYRKSGCNEAGVSGLPVPIFYNEQQLTNNVTPEMQMMLESWRKEPPPAPCAKRCTSRISKIPPYEAGENDIKSVRKKLFEEKEKEETDKCTPPQMTAPKTPMSSPTKRRMDTDENHKVKKKLFDDDSSTGSCCIRNDSKTDELKCPGKTDIKLSNIENVSSGSETPTKDSSEETELYWGGDSIENPSLLLEIERLERQDSTWERRKIDTDDISDDMLLAAVLEAEEDETQKNLLDMEMMVEKTCDPLSGSNHLVNSVDNHISANLPSTSGASNYLSRTSPSLCENSKMSYKLADLHKRIVGYEMVNEHRAEDDCLALVRIFHKAFGQVCPWIDCNATYFTDVVPLYNNKLKTKKGCLSPDKFPYQII